MDELPITTAGFPAGIVVAQAEGVPVAGPEGALGIVEGEHGEVVGVETVEHEKGAFPPFDPTHFASQLLWLVITFGALYFLMKRVVLPRIGGIIEDRRDRIANDLDQADRLKRQSDDAIAGYERALSEARAGAFAIAAEARDKAKAEAAKRQAEIEASLDEKLREAEARIGEIKAKALADVDAIASEATEAAVERLIGKKASAAEVKSAITAARKSGAASHAE